MAVFSATGSGSLLPWSLGSIAWIATLAGAYSLGGCLLTRRVGFSPYLLAVGWIAVEFGLRPLALHHGLLASTQGADGLVIRAIGSFAGYALVAFVVAYVNASILEILDGACRCASTRVAGRRTASPEFFCPLANVAPYLIALFSPAMPRAPPAA